MAYGHVGFGAAGGAEGARDGTVGAMALVLAGLVARRGGGAARVWAWHPGAGAVLLEVRREALPFEDGVAALCAVRAPHEQLVHEVGDDAAGGRNVVRRVRGSVHGAQGAGVRAGVDVGAVVVLLQGAVLEGGDDARAAKGVAAREHARRHKGVRAHGTQQVGVHVADIVQRRRRQPGAQR